MSPWGAASTGLQGLEWLVQVQSKAWPCLGAPAILAKQVSISKDPSGFQTESFLARDWWHFMRT